jgi:hypothetical protein
MRRRVRHLFKRRSNNNDEEAVAGDGLKNGGYEALGETPFGLEVWVPGVNPSIEYVKRLPSSLVLLLILDD